MKSTQKGNQYEREVKAILESQGWTVEGQHRKVMFLGPGKMIMAGRDIFGCDIVAKKAGERTRWIQVSTVENKSKKEKQVLGYPINLDHESIERWLRIPKKKAYRRFTLERVVKEVYEGEEGVGTAVVSVFVEKNTETYQEAA